MNWIITFLLCCSLQASINSETLTYEFFLPKKFENMLSLTGKLVSKNPEIFPDLETLYDDTYKKQLKDFQAMKIQNIGLSELIKEMPKKFNKCGHRHFTFFYFFNNIDDCIHDIFFSDMPDIRKEHSDILTKPKQEQADIVYETYEAKNITLFMEAYGNFIKEHVRFTDEPEDRFGRLIINGEEVHRGTPQEVE